MATHATLVVDACQARITGAGGERLSGARRDRLRHRLQVHGRAAVQRLRAGADGAGRERAAAARRLRHHLPPRRMAGGLARRRACCRTASISACCCGSKRRSSSSSASRRFDEAAVARVILAFHAAVRAEIVEQTEARRVAPYPPGEVEEADTHPIEMRTLSTLDLSAGGASFEDAQAWHKTMALAGVRVGQPVKCVRLADGRWGATLRIGLTMWQVVGPDRALRSRRSPRASPPTWPGSAKPCSPPRPRARSNAAAPPAPSAAGCRDNSRQGCRPSPRARPE